jgi:hypothetical protein
MTLALFASVAAAQGRYRVVVGIAGTKQMSLIELVPCIPAEGSGCGAWVSRVIDTAADTTLGPTPPAITTGETAPDHLSRISVQGSSLIVEGLSKQGIRQRVRKIHDPLRTPTAVAISPDSRYAFVVLEAKSDTNAAQVRMIDLSTQTAIATMGLRARPAGIAIAPR